MKVIALDRGFGKSSIAVRYSGLTGGVIICPSLQDVAEKELLAKKLGYNIPKPLTINQVFEQRHRGRKDIETFIIDDVDAVLQFLCGNTPISLVTLTTD